MGIIKVRNSTLMLLHLAIRNIFYIFVFKTNQRLYPQRHDTVLSIKESKIVEELRTHFEKIKKKNKMKNKIMLTNH